MTQRRRRAFNDKLAMTLPTRQPPIADVTCYFFAPRKLPSPSNACGRRAARKSEKKVFAVKPARAGDIDTHMSAYYSRPARFWAKCANELARAAPPSAISRIVEINGYYKQMPKLTSCANPPGMINRERAARYNLCGAARASGDSPPE